MKIEISWAFYPNYYADNEICNGNGIELDLWKLAAYSLMVSNAGT